MADIIIVGVPRSGNVWLSRLLGDALDRPVIGIRGAMSLASEGGNRPGPGRVMQAHAYPGRGDTFWCGHYQADMRHVGDRKVVCIVRDPRDVVISSAAFWQWGIDDTLQKMIDGPGPVNMPSWKAFMDAWWDEDVPIVRYEDLHEDTVGELERLLDGIEETAWKPLADVVERQSFSVKRAEMEKRGDQYAFGRDAQLSHLRSGRTGEWRDWLSPSQVDRAWAAWGSTMRILGYDGN